MFSTAIQEILGLALIFFAFQNVFRDIFHPTRSGSLSDFIGALGSRLFVHTKLRAAIGPACLVAVIFSWVALTGIGFALVYLPLIPGEIGGQISSGTADRILHSLYLSFGSIATFQTFDIDLHRSWLRLIVTIQGLVGLSLITASISWLVLLYPALERTRFLATKTFALVEVKERCNFSVLPDEGLLRSMADRVMQARIDLVLFPILLNFYARDPSQTLALALPHLQTMAEDASKPGFSEEVRSAGTQLLIALEKFADMLSERVLSTEATNIKGVFEEFARRKA